MGHEPYELIDFGACRKLERFGDVHVDRPCAAADNTAPSRPGEWGRATARYERTHSEEGIWTPAGSIPDRWTVAFALQFAKGGQDTVRQSATPAGRDTAEAVGKAAVLTLRLQASPFGHVGVFPEQRENWQWIASRVAKSLDVSSRPLKVLNLFAYTGGSTLAAAAAGAEVVHVDAARNMVDRARENAVLSGLGSRPIRWITEDAMKFCRRELKRENRYDAVILDPPSYGHGPKGEPWKIGSDLLPLLALCGQLTAASRAFVLVTCHSPGIGPADLAAYVSEGIFGNCAQPPSAGELSLKTETGRRLPSGVYARWP